MNSRAFNSGCWGWFSCSQCHGLRLFLSFYYIIPRELPFVLMFVDSWVQEDCCRSKHHIYTQSRKESGRGSIGPIYFILSGKQKPSLSSQKTSCISLVKMNHGHPLLQRRLGKWVFIWEPCWSDQNYFHLYEDGERAVCRQWTVFLVGAWTTE